MYSIFYIKLFGYKVKHMFVILTPFYNIAQGIASTAQVAIIYTEHCANIGALTLKLCAIVFVGFFLYSKIIFEIGVIKLWRLAHRVKKL